MSNYIYYKGELYHYGVLGMKWGRRRKSKNYDYTPTSLRARIARKQNEDVDEGFDEWAEKREKRDAAISKGRKANSAKIAYESDKSNPELRDAYKSANKDYKKALRKNTSYYKGVVRQEVDRDVARKYLSKAKTTKKRLDADPENKELRKQYNEFRSKHDIYRAKGRKAADVGSRRSQFKAGIKRGITIGVKTAAAAGAIAAGTYAVNKYLQKHNVTVNGKRMSLSSATTRSVVDLAKRGRDLIKNITGFMW